MAESGRDLQGDNGLETCVLLSLFTDRRVDDEKLLPDESGYKGGWWGNQFNDFEIGSRLWLLRRSKKEDETLTLARQYCLEALQWMIDEVIAQTVDVTTSFIDDETMSIEIQIYRPDVANEQEFAYKYFFNWENQIVKRG